MNRRVMIGGSRMQASVTIVVALTPEADVRQMEEAIQAAGMATSA